MLYESTGTTPRALMTLEPSLNKKHLRKREGQPILGTGWGQFLMESFFIHVWLLYVIHSSQRPDRKNPFIRVIRPQVAPRKFLQQSMGEEPEGEGEKEEEPEAVSFMEVSRVHHKDAWQNV